jgi:flagellar protein FliS
MSNSPSDAYKAAGVLTADPISLTTMLFDGCLKAMRKARLHHESGNRKGFLDEIGRAHLIVGELLATLDMEQGELAKQLSAIYAYCLRCLIESTLEDLSRLDEAEKHIRRVAEAWKAATAGFRLQSASVTARAAA